VTDEEALTQLAYSKDAGQPDTILSSRLRRELTGLETIRLWARRLQGDPLRRKATDDLRGVLPATGPGLRRHWPLLILLGQFALFALAVLAPEWPMRAPVNDATTLTALWAVEATVFGLVASLTPVLIATFTDPLDRARMIRRFRTYSFDWTVLLGFQTLLLMGVLLLTLSMNRSSATAAGQVVGAQWIWITFFVLAVALFNMIHYTYHLLLKTSDERAVWIKEEVRDYFVSSMVDAYSLVLLKRWVKQQFPNISTCIEVEFDTKGLDWNKLGSESIVCPVPANPERATYINDISLDRLRTWLRKLPLNGQGALAGICLVGSPHRHLLAGTHIAVAWKAESVSSDLRGLIGEIQRAYKIVRPPSNPLYFRTGMKDLRDRASAAARNGKIAEFESALETFKDLTVVVYDLTRKLDEQLQSLGVDPDDRRRVDFNLEARVALRGAVHELGEEVLPAGSPNVVKAWMHHPHRVLEATRSYSIRTEAAIMYPWFRAANYIRGSGRDESASPDLVFQSLRRRLLTYGQNLLKTQELETGSAPISTEFDWYLRILGKLLSVIDVGQRQIFTDKLQRIWELVPEEAEERENWICTIWIECARHLAADRLNPEVTFGPSTDTNGFANCMADVKRRVGSLATLMSVWSHLQLTQGWSELQMSYLYERLIDMTWEEQVEVGQGVIDPLVVRHRGRACIAWLAIELYTNGSVELLTEESRTQLSDLLNGEDCEDIVADAETIATILDPANTGVSDCVKRIRSDLIRLDPTPEGIDFKPGILSTIAARLRLAGEILDNPGGGLLFATQSIGQANATLHDLDPERWREVASLLDRAELAILRREFETARKLLRNVLGELAST